VHTKLDIYVFIFIMLIVHQQLYRPSDRNNNIDVKLITYVGYVFGKLGLDKYCSVVVAVNVCVVVQPVPAEYLMKVISAY
jgi:hypothetical protein